MPDVIVKNVGVIYLELMGSQIAFRLALERYIVTVFSMDKSRVQKILASSTPNLKASSLPKEIGDTCVRYGHNLCKI